MAAVTSSRSDFGIYVPLLEAIRADQDLQLDLIATGMHLSPEHGNTLEEIGEQGSEGRFTVESFIASDRRGAVARSMANGISGLAQLFASWRLDLFFVLADRYDVIPTAMPALLHRIPVAHIHGGELTKGAIDDSLRHCEEDWRITVSGAPALDRLRRTPRPDDASP